MLAGAGLLLAPPASAAELTALDHYLARPDTNFSYRLVHTIPGTGHTTFVLEMNSQAWLTTNEVHQPVWRHRLLVVEPDQVDHSTALLFIGGGSLDGPSPRAADRILIRIALATKSVVAELHDVPNQPLVFAGTTNGLYEDAIIAYSWNKFLRTGDEQWPLRLPMTKSAVRALDTITAFCGDPEGGRVRVNSFVVSGASKRGWTTWSTAIVDQRVVAIIPLVIDLLNIEPSFRHHYRGYGFWAPAVNDYVQQRIMDWMGTPEFRALMVIEDPYEYRDRLARPKFIINAAGDQFFLPDSSQFYFADLPGPKYLRYVPNADHSLRNTDAPQTLEACYRAVLTGAKLPEFSWKLEPDGAIRVTARDQPAEVKLWQATNPNARDFRLETIGPVWTNTPVTPEADGVYLGKVATPSRGWTAFFVELTYPGRGPTPFKFTTDVRVLPETLPHRLDIKPRPN